MDLKKVDIKEIGKSGRIDWQETLIQFVEMNTKIVELIDYPHSKPTVCVTSAAHAIDNFGFNNVTVRKRKEHIYLVRIDIK